MSQPTTVTAQDVVDQMFRLREKRSALKKEFEAEDRKLRESYERGENWLLAHMQETGHKSFKVEGATVFTSTTPRYSFGDWDAFANWVRETGNVDLLQHRVSVTNMKQYIQESDGATPPGVKPDAVVSVNIRKS